MNNRPRLLGRLIGLLCLEIAVTFAAYAQTVPPQALQAGYGTLTFSSEFDPKEIDLKGEYSSGFKWYLWNFFKSKAKADRIVFATDHTLTFLGDETGPNGQIASAAQARKGFVGTAFGGGGYFEARLRFNPEQVIAGTKSGWPSFWSMALEHLVSQTPIDKKDSSDYKRFVEVDFFEYDLFPYLRERNVYGGAMHDWHGVWKKTCPGGFCNVVFPSIKKWVPIGTNFNEYHSYGFLWVPATPRKQGYAQYYFDNVPVGSAIFWNEYQGKLDPSEERRRAFSIIDKQHLVLILGTGVDKPMSVQSVRVFQKSSDGNVRR